MNKKKNKKRLFDFENNLSFTNLNLIVLFSNILLILSSLFYEYNSSVIFFSSLIILISGIGFFFSVISKLAIPLEFILMILVLIYNYEFLFLFLLNLILGTLVLNLLNLNLKVPLYTYTFIAIFIFSHMIWFNILPFGYSDSWDVKLGSKNDKLSQNNIYVNDSHNVLSDSYSFGDLTWREFRRDGSFHINSNTPIEIDNLSVEIEIQYDPSGPLLINDELIYDPKWGSYVNVLEVDKSYIYVPKDLNLAPRYEDVGVEEFLRITNRKSIEEYFYYEYKVQSSDGITLSSFLNTRGLTLQEFLDFELNKNANQYYIKDEQFESLEDFLNSNFPNGIPIKDNTGLYKEIEEDLNQKYFDQINSINHYLNYDSTSNLFESTIRGDFTFFGVFDKKIIVEFDKQDLNWYVGFDDLYLTVFDFNGDIIDKFYIEDNSGDESDLREMSQFKTIKYEREINFSGIYKIEIKPATYNRNEDFLIQNLTLNTNKAVVDSQFLLWDSAKFYITNQKNSMDIRYWWDGYDQTIEFSKIDLEYLNVDDRNVWKTINFTNRDSFKIQKARVSIMPNGQLGLFDNSFIDSSLENEIQISKSEDILKKNVQLTTYNPIKITGTQGTKIYEVELNLN